MNEHAARSHRVLIVDDDTVIREGLALLLPRVVTHTYSDIESLIGDGADADVVLLDLGLKGTGRYNVLQGIDGVRRVVKHGYRVLIYTNERRREVLACAIGAGACGVVHKAESVQLLERAITEIAGGGVWITQALSGLAELADRKGRLPALSERQREVLAGRARGEPFTRLARRMGISSRTAEEHMAVVSRRFADYLQTHSPADLERLLGLDPPDLFD